jgi:hypothetical protein
MLFEKFGEHLLHHIFRISLAGDVFMLKSNEYKTI